VTSDAPECDEVSLETPVHRMSCTRPLNHPIEIELIRIPPILLYDRLITARGSTASIVLRRKIQSGVCLPFTEND
jgi:hypothetical protein